MSFASGTVAVAPKTTRGLKLDGYALEIIHFTKLTGDTTATVYATVLRKIFDVQVFDASGVAIAASVTIDNTHNQSSHKGHGSAAFTSLGSGTSGVIIFKGSRV